MVPNILDEQIEAEAESLTEEQAAALDQSEDNAYFRKKLVADTDAVGVAPVAAVAVTRA